MFTWYVQKILPCSMHFSINSNGADGIGQRLGNIFITQIKEFPDQGFHRRLTAQQKPEWWLFWVREVEASPSVFSPGGS